MKNRLTKIVLLALLVLTLFSSIIPLASAVGIRPARLTYPFQEGKEFMFEYTIINRGEDPARFALYTCGTFWNDLNITTVSAKIFGNQDCTIAQRTVLSELDQGDIKIEDAGVFLNPHEEKKIYATMKLPAVTGFDPGIVETRLGALDLPLNFQPGQTTLGGVAAVEAQLWLKVPFPGKRLTLEPSVDDVVAGQKTKIRASVTSEGTEKVDSAALTIDILDPDGVRKDRIALDAKSIAPGESADYLTIWDSKGYDPGTYTALFRLTYDTQTMTKEVKFRIGGLNIDVEGIEAPAVQPGGIAKITVNIASKWGDTIPNVYADVLVKDQLDKDLAVVKTQSKDVKPFEKTTLEAFWETGDARVGTYTLKTTLHFASNESYGDGTLEIKKELYQQVSFEYIALAIVVILLVGAAWMFKDKIKLTGKQDEGSAKDVQPPSEPKPPI